METLEPIKNIEDGERIQLAIDIAIKYGGTDDAHHKAWVIDQILRILAGDQYEEIIKKAKEGEDGPETYDWDKGIAP